jgi:hypothetical protein
MFATGTVGFLTSFYFVHYLFSSVKIDWVLCGTPECGAFHGDNKVAGRAFEHLLEMLELLFSLLWRRYTA